MADEEDLFDITLIGVERTLECKEGGAICDCKFDCVRTRAAVQITISIDTAPVTTLEILSPAMSDMHWAFSALAEQTKAWRIESGCAKI